MYVLSRRRPDLRLVVGTALFLNLFTHPLATMMTWNRGWMFGEIELVVLLIETLGYRIVARQSWPRAFGLALVANLVTALLAIALFAGAGR